MGQIPIVLRHVEFKLVDIYGPNCDCLTSCGIQAGGWIRAKFQLSDVMWHASRWMYTDQIPIVWRHMALSRWMNTGQIPIVWRHLAIKSVDVWAKFQLSDVMWLFSRECTYCSTLDCKGLTWKQLRSTDQSALFGFWFWRGIRNRETILVKMVCEWVKIRQKING